MKLEMFTVYDDKALAYLRPFFSPTVATALRSVKSAAEDATHDFSKHPHDYMVYHIGYFDEDTAEVGRLELPVPLGLVSQIIAGYDEPVDYEKEQKSA